MSKNTKASKGTTEVPDQPQRRLLTRREVAERLGVAVGTLDRWAAERSGPPFVKFGTCGRSPVRYPSDLLDAFIERHQIMPKQ